MITSLLGKTFLKAYNQKYNKQYTPKEFFEKEYFELFFNHPKYLQWLTNSPFVQMKAGQKNETLSVAERKEKLTALFDKVEKERPDASFAIGYSAADSKEFASTSGLISDINITVGEDDIYCSWFGAGLGIGVAGGYSLLINDPEILLETYEGCKIYRKYLNDISLHGKLSGNKINSWNGQWIAYRFGNNYKDDFDFGALESQHFFKAEGNAYGIDTVNWSNLFFSLSNLYPDNTLNAYIYSFGQTNKTIGFIPIYLKAGKKLKDVFRKLYHSEAPFSNKDFQSLFGMHIKRACELGNIGLHALRPEHLKKYMDEAKNLAFKTDEDYLIYQSYKIWLVAMLSKNKEEITDYTLGLAELIQRYRKGAKGTERKNLIEKDLLGTKSKKEFIDALTSMIPDVEKEDLTSLKQLKDEVHLMTNEEFVYFNTLLKFDYAFVEKTN